MVPFLALGTAAGLFTAWVERALVGAEGAEFDLTAVERVLIAGRTTWFYLTSLLWPAPLVFIYPRWHVSGAVWWQYVYPATAIGMLAILCAIRRRWRAPLAAALFFVGTLVPVLGFFNVYPFAFSFVADHFQYLASLGVIALGAAGAALLLERNGWWLHTRGDALCLGVLLVLGFLTWRQSHVYADVERLYRATIDRNPECWMAYNNLGGALVARGAADEALPLIRRALELRPAYAEAHNNLALALASRGEADLAIAHYRRALTLRPGYAEAHNNLGFLLAARGHLDQAIAQYEEALEVDAGYAGVHYNLATALAARGQLAPAVAHLRRALELRPDYAEAHNSLGIILADAEHLDQARAHFEAAVALQPRYAEAHNNLGIVLARTGHRDQAIAHFRAALDVDPADARVRDNLFTAMGWRDGRAAPAGSSPSR